jgi:DNA-binding transcriptional LysR family regulator
MFILHYHHAFFAYEVLLNPNWFDDLATVRETGHFSMAARRRNLSQPALSRRIRALESWAGFELVNRQSRPVTLTSAGEQILEVALTGIKRLTQERDLLRDISSSVADYVVSFAAQHSVAWRFFPNWLQDFENKFGSIKSRLRADDLDDCIASFRAGEVDFLIAYNSPHIEGTLQKALGESLVIGHDRLIPVCKPDETGRPLYPIFLAEKQMLPYVGYSPLSSLGQLFSRHMEGRLDRGCLKPVYQHSMVGAIRVRACEGLGISWLPETIVSVDLASGALVRAGKPEWNIDMTINLIRSSHAQNSHITKIWEHVRQHHTPGQEFIPRSCY